MMNKIVKGILILSISILFAGCSGAQSQTKNEAMATVVPGAQSKSYSLLNNRKLELKNCNSAEDLHRSLGLEEQVSSVVFMEDVATSTKTGNTQAISAEMKATLEEQIRSAYQQILEEANAKVEATDMVVDANTMRTFNISWSTEVYSATIIFTMDDEEWSVPYTVTLNIPHSTTLLSTGCTG